MYELLDGIVKGLAPYPVLQLGALALILFFGTKAIRKGEREKQEVHHEPTVEQRERWVAFRHIKEIKEGIDRLNVTQAGIADGLKALAAAVHNRMQWEQFKGKE